METETLEVRLSEVMLTFRYDESHHDIIRSDRWDIIGEGINDKVISVDIPEISYDSTTKEDIYITVVQEKTNYVFKHNPIPKDYEIKIKIGSTVIEFFDYTGVPAVFGGRIAPYMWSLSIDDIDQLRVRSFKIPTLRKDQTAVPMSINLNYGCVV